MPDLACLIFLFAMPAYRQTALTDFLKVELLSLKRNIYGSLFVYREKKASFFFSGNDLPICVLAYC